MAGNPLTVVRQVLQVYADRGIFRGFSEKKTKDGKNEFKFLWLTGQPMTLIYEGKNSTLRFKNLLLNVPSHSTMYSDLKAFVKEKFDGISQNTDGLIVNLPRSNVLIEEERFQLV